MSLTIPQIRLVITHEGVPLMIDEADAVVTDLTVTLPLLAEGVAGFSCKLLNANGEYTGDISEFDPIEIYVWRKGDTMKKVFKGRIMSVGTEGFGSSQDYYITLTGMDLGQEMHAPPNLMKNIYEVVNGRTIILDAIALCNEIDGLYVEDEIASTHDFEFNEVTPYSVIKDVCEVAKTSEGAVGFDGYIDEAGHIHIFKRGKYTSSVSLTEKIEHYKKQDDVHRVRNKIKVYGAAERAYPLDKDAWTESLTPADGSWASGTGTGSVSFDTTEKIVGTGSIKLNVTGSDYYGRLILTLNDGKEANCYDVPDGYGDITFQIKLSQPYSGSVTVQLEDDAGMVCRKEFNAKIGEWVLINASCGRNAKDQWTYSPFNSQEFDWKKVKKVDITCHFPATGTGAFWVDNLFFNKRRFEGFAEDATSQGKYGVRWKEPIVDDSLKSDAECLKKAESYRDFLKEKVITLTDFEVEGDNGFNPGDKQLVIIPNDNINEYFRILEIRHVIRGIHWSTFLSLTDEPQFIDYVFTKLSEKIERIEKSVVAATPVVGAGGGGGGSGGSIGLIQIPGGTFAGEDGLAKFVNNFFSGPNALALFVDAFWTGIKIAAGAIGTLHLEDLSVTNAKIANLAVDTAKIADATITSAKIGIAQIQTAHIEDLTVTTAKIANAAITSAKIGTAEIETAHIKDLAVETAKIANAAITTAKIGTAQIETAHIKDAQITTAKIMDLAVETAKIANAAITTAKIGDLQVTTAKIADAAITEAKIGTAQIKSAHIDAAQITTAKIEDLAVTTAKIADAAITTAKIATASIETAHIKDAQITDAKIANLSVAEAHIKAAAITSAKIADLNVLTAHINDAAITTAKISDGAITSAKIGAAEVKEANIENLTISAAKIKDLAVETAKIANLSITTLKLADGSVTKVKTDTTIAVTDGSRTLLAEKTLALPNVGVYGRLMYLVKNGLVLWLPMDEGSGSITEDQSGEENDGTIVGASWETNGKISKCLSFDGVDDRVTVGDDPSLDLTDSFSIVAWIYPTGWGEGNEGRIVDK